MAIANALQALDLRKGPSGAGGVMGLLGGGMPKMPAGMPGMPAGMAMPQMPGMAGMGIPGMAGGFPGMGGLPGTALGMGGAEGDMMARMRTMMPGVGETPAGTGIDPEQMARVMQSMSQPLSPRG